MLGRLFQNGIPLLPESVSTAFGVGLMVIIMGLKSDSVVSKENIRKYFGKVDEFY